MKSTLSSVIIKSLETNKTKCLIGRKINERWIWDNKKQLLNSISYCHDYLKSENIYKGDRVAYKGVNSVEWLSWNIACNSLGGIWVPMYSDQSDNYCKHVINDCNPKVLITDNPNKQEENVKTLHNKIEPYKNSNSIDNVYNDISTLIYTSGTTGNPKGVVLSNENILSNIKDIHSRFSTMPETVSLNILPWAHIYSQTCELYYNIINENKMALSSNRKKFLNELKEIEPDVLYVVPRILELIKSKIDFLDAPLIKNVIPYILKRVFGKNLKIIYVGGAKLESSTKEFFKRNNIIICEGYGCTELSPMVCVNHMEYPRDEKSVGKILDNVLVEIIDNEIQVSGPNVMKGYWNNEKATKEVLVERDNKIWYKTGDGGYVKDGFLFYTGRNSYNYKLSNGKFVNVENVESVVKKHIKCSCVLFSRDNIHNELIVNKEIHYDVLEQINNDLNKYLRIQKTHWLEDKDWENYLTPKMSIKRKEIIKDFIDNKLNIIIINDYINKRYNRRLKA